MFANTSVIDYWFFLGTIKLENEKKYNETKKKMKKRNEAKYIKQSIKDPKTINERVKINEILSG